MFRRLLKDRISSDFFKGKAILLVGSRQVGKTTLVDEILNEMTSRKIRRLNLDSSIDRNIILKEDFQVLDQVFGNDEIIFIDEAQRLPSIGLVLKLLVDNYGAKKQIIATGSSSLNLLDNTSEPLTGRKFTYFLYPLSLQEIYQDHIDMQKGYLSNLIYGFYPEVASKRTNEEKIRLLRELSTSYLYKDILEFQDVRNPEVLAKLLQLLALQIGSEVSYSELASNIGIDYKTVERYIDLLEKSYVVFRVSAFSTNKRREISKNKKVYFYDLGIRNTVIDNFNPLDIRTDRGQMWENFLMVERMKYRNYNNIYAKQHFWRTYDRGEIDLVEERDGKLFGYEFKLKRDRAKIPQSWKKYQNAEFKIINPESLVDFVF